MFTGHEAGGRSRCLWADVCFTVATLIPEQLCSFCSGHSWISGSGGEAGEGREEDHRPSKLTLIHLTDIYPGTPGPGEGQLLFPMGLSDKALHELCSHWPQTS
ncbi:hypothetical protein F2P79_008056 [Pimephales promelas]|nr:hypothetical protein F2P79_008056 [Pimephales promelas]